MILALILIELGGGRKKINDKINFSVGYENVIDVGSIVDAINSFSYCTFYLQKKFLKKYKKNIQSCFEISDEKVDKLATIYKIIN